MRLSNLLSLFFLLNVVYPTLTHAALWYSVSLKLKVKASKQLPLFLRQWFSFIKSLWLMLLLPHQFCRHQRHRRCTNIKKEKLQPVLRCSPCMHSRVVSPCVGSRGAWREVHVWWCGFVVAMTIILPRYLRCTERCLLSSEGVVLTRFSSCALHEKTIRPLTVVISQAKNLHNKVFFHQSGQSPKIIRAKGVGLERTDSQTVGEFQRGRRKGRYTMASRLSDSLIFSNGLISSLCMFFHWCIVGCLLFLCGIFFIDTEPDKYPRFTPGVGDVNEFTGTQLNQHKRDFNTINPQLG